MLSGPTVKWQVSSPVHECSDSAVSVGNWWSCWTSKQGKRCAVSSGSCGYQTQEPCTSVDTVAMCGADVVSVQQVSNWYRGFANGQVSWMRSDLAVHQHQTCISLTTMKWCGQTDVYHWSSWQLSWHLSSHNPVSGMMSMKAITERAVGHNNWMTNRMAASLTNLQCYKAECTEYLSCIITHGCTTDEDGIHGVEKFHLPAHKFKRIEGMRQIQNFGIVTGSFLLIAWCMVSHWRQLPTK